MSYKCISCKGSIKKNYPFGVNSNPEERGHKPDCNKKDFLKKLKKQKATENTRFNQNKRKSY